MSSVESLHARPAHVYQYEVDRVSLEYFHPAPTSTRRTASAKSAVFNLVSTIIGGGVLSLPYALDKCGLVCFTLFMTLAALASDFSLYVLVSCSRRSGARTYAEVVSKALGPGQAPAIITMVLLALLTYLALVAYLVLIQDLVVALVERYCLGLGGGSGVVGSGAVGLGSGAEVAHPGSGLLFLLPRGERRLITIACVLLVSPVLFFRKMDALRVTSVVSLVSMLVLALGIFIRATESPPASYHHHHPTTTSSIKLFPDQSSDLVYAFPIISVAFLCHFNVLPVYSELHRPTRRRLKRVVHVTMGSSYVFYMIVGILGYVYAKKHRLVIQDDILNNFSTNDGLVNLGRVGLLITILLSLPLLLFPCRETLSRLLVRVTRMWSRARRSSSSLGQDRELHHLLLASTTTTADHRTMSDVHASVVISTNIDTNNDTDTDETSVPSSMIEHVILTCVIISSALALSFVLPGVAVVWNIMGSTVGILFAYIIPTLSYICIRDQKSFYDRRKCTAVLVLCIGSLAFCICTIQACRSLMAT